MTIPAAEAQALGGDPQAVALWQVLRGVLLSWPGVSLKAQKSQVGVWAAHPFAAAWCPGQALGRRATPLVISVFARERLAGPWKEVVEPAPGRFTHHLEITTPGDVSPAILQALRLAAEAAR